MKINTAKAEIGTTLKTEILVLESQKKKLKKELAKLTKEFEKIRTKLGVEYKKVPALAKELRAIKVHGTKKELALHKKLDDCVESNEKLQVVREEYTTKIEKLKEELTNLELKLMVLKERELSKIDANDEMITQVFALNDAMVQASTAREQFLKRHVFPFLIDENGNMRSQITHTTSDELRKMVVMVNTLTIMKPDLAAEAQREVQSFFDRFEKPSLADPYVEAMFTITRQLLVEKTTVKVGPNLSRFISMELDGEIFPELARAQLLYKQSIWSKKTNSYIRLYARQSKHDKFEVVPQS
ncbi:MAG: hypothetical protein V4606_01510 [Patescibacteria group bacterium]